MFAHPCGWYGDAKRRHQLHATIPRFILAAFLVLVSSSSVPAQECYQPGTYLPLVGDTGDDIGTCIEVEILQSWVYVIRTSPEPRSLVVWSLHDPELPEKVATVPLPEEAEHLRAQGNRLYFTSEVGYYSQLNIWDVSNPYSPAELGTMPINSFVLDLEVEGNLLALCTGHFDLSFIDVSNPAKPIWLSDILPAPEQIEVTDVELFPTHAVCSVRAGPFGVAVVNILDPSEPVVTMYEETGIWLRGFTMEDDGQHGWACDGDMNLYRVNVANPGGVLKFAGGGGLQVRVFDDLVITMGPYGIIPRVHVKDVDRKLSLRDRWPDRVYDIARKGNFLVSAMGPKGLHVRQLTPETPAPYTGAALTSRTRFTAPALGPTDTPGLVLELNPDYSRLGVIDYTDPGHPRFRGTWGCDDPSVAAARGEDVVVGTGDGVHLLHLGPDGYLEFRKTLWPDYDLQSIIWDGDLLWLGTAQADLRLYDMSDPTNPDLLFHEHLQGSLRHLEREGDYLVVGSFLSGVFVLDVSTPRKPVLLGHLGGVGAEYMSVLGDHAYVGSRLQSLVKVVSLADPTAPVVVETLLLPSSPQAVLAYENHLWVGRYNQVEVFSLVDGLPQATSFYQAAGYTVGDFEMAGNLVALGSDYTYFMRRPCLEVAAVTTPRVTLFQDIAAVPNPFNPRTSISFEITGNQHACLTVYDLRGHLVSTLVDEFLPAGIHEVDWDGFDADGNKVPSGVYLSRLEAGGKVAHGRMTLVR